MGSISHGRVLRLSAFAYALFLIAPRDMQPIIVQIFGVAATMFVVRKTTTFAPDDRRPWQLLATAGFASLAGGVVKVVHGSIIGSPAPVPSPGDALFVMAYAAILACEFTLVRARSERGERGHLLDALLPTSVVALPLWSLVLQPYVLDPSNPLLERLTNVGYAFLMLAMLAATLRLAVGEGGRPRSYHLLAGAVMVLMASDVMVTVLIANGLETYANQYLVIPIFALMAAAVAHPTAPLIANRPVGRRSRLDRSRLVLLSGSLLLPPVIVLATALGRPDESIVGLLVGYSMISLLVLARIVELLRAEERAKSREAILRTTGERLLVATSRDDVSYMLKAGAKELLGRNDAVVDLVDALPEDSSGGLSAAQGGRQLLAFVTVPGNPGAGVLTVDVDAVPAVEVTGALETLAKEAGLANRAIDAADSLVRERAERRFKALIDNAGDIVAVVDDDGLITYVSPAVTRLLGYPIEWMQGRHWQEFVHPANVDGAGNEAYAEGPEGELRLRHATGTFHWFEIRTRDLTDAPDVNGTVVTARHIDDRKQAEALLQRSETRFRALVQHSSDVVLVVDADGVIEYASPAVEELLGVSPPKAVGLSLPELVEGDGLADAVSNPAPRSVDSRLVVVQTVTKWATPPRTIEFTVSDLREEDGVEGIVLNGRDVTERQSLELSLRHQALHDDLTGLPNRSMLIAEMSEALGQASELPVALLFIDIDDFKDVNDSLGHEAGDLLLGTIAGRLLETTRVGDTAARIGGDEFAVLVPQALGEASVIEICDRIIKALSEPVLVGGRAVTCMVSIGVAFDHDRSSTPAVLIRNADVAMYRAKDRGKGRVEIFEEHLHTSVFHRFELKNDLRRGIENDELRLFYQPIIDLATSQIVGAEALVRWQHPAKGLLGPDDFIPVAEATGMVVDLGQWVLEHAATSLDRWTRVLLPNMRMSVNVSARQLEQSGFVDNVRAVVDGCDARPEQMCLEITESVFMSDPLMAVAQLRSLRAMGLRIAIDDFGTGYSSLKQVQDYPFDILKIDKSFVDRISEEGQGTVLRTIMRLADDLGAITVAEGIEHATQLQTLNSLGCTLGQGYYFSRPVDAAAFEELLIAQASTVNLSESARG